MLYWARRRERDANLGIILHKDWIQNNFYQLGYRVNTFDTIIYIRERRGWHGASKWVECRQIANFTTEGGGRKALTNNEIYGLVQSEIIKILNEGLGNIYEHTLREIDTSTKKQYLGYSESGIM
jgi:hypothetical protein